MCFWQCVDLGTQGYRTGFVLHQVIEKLVARSPCIRRFRINGYKNVKEIFSIDIFGNEPLDFRESANSSFVLPNRSIGRSDLTDPASCDWREMWTEARLR